MLSTTKFEATRVKPTQADHIYIEGSATVRGKTNNMTAHMHLWDDGKWHLGTADQQEYQQNQQAYFVDTWDGSKFVSVSFGFMKEGREAVTAFVNDWAEKNANTIREAQREHLADGLKRLEEEHEEAKQELIDIGARLATAKTILEEFDDLYPKEPFGAKPCG